MKKSELITLIKQIINDISKEKELLYDEEKPIEEISTTADAGSYMTPKAFTTGPASSKKFEKNGFTAWKESENWFVNQDRLSRRERIARKRSPVNENLDRYLDKGSSDFYTNYQHEDIVVTAENLIKLTDKYFATIQKEIKKAGPFLGSAIKTDLWQTIKEKFNSIKIEPTKYYKK